MEEPTSDAKYSDISDDEAIEIRDVRESMIQYGQKQIQMRKTIDTSDSDDPYFIEGKLYARHLPHLAIASIRPTFPGINPDQEMRQCINKSYRAALITSENPELREVDLEPSSKRGCSNK